MTEREKKRSLREREEGFERERREKQKVLTEREREKGLDREREKKKERS